MTTTRPKHILGQFDIELEAIKSQLLLMADVVDRQVSDAIEAFLDGDQLLAKRVVGGDRQVNELERNIDERCISLLALRQPEASDLRFIAATLKIVTDLERNGDLAVSTAHQVDALDHGFSLLAIDDLPRMVKLAQEMLRGSVQAFVEGDLVKAAGVMTSEATVARSMNRLTDDLREAMRRHPEAVSSGIATISVAKHVERIAAHATNIAEMVVYIARGEDVRHVK